VRVGFAGGGVMAEAMFSRAIASGLCTVGDISVGEPVPARRDDIAERYGIAVHADNAPAIEDAEIVVIAVKPQHISHVYHDLHGALGAEQTALSIAAGVTIGSLAAGLSHDRIIRVMPNTPAQIGAGMSVWTATPGVPDAAQDAAASLLATLGREWRVDSEDYLDMATAVSGSGPAYVFAFIEALTEAGVFVGMPRDMAQTLAVETTLGSARLASESGEAPAILRERVTSPGGTTAAALQELERRGFKSALIEGVTAAFHRSQELGGKR